MADIITGKEKKFTSRKTNKLFQDKITNITTKA